MRSPSRSKQEGYPDTSMYSDKLDRIIGLSLLMLAGIILVISFWKMGSQAQDSIVLHSYITTIAQNGEKAFGYGGEGDDEKVDVPFQGRDMSNVSFTISRDTADRYWLKGKDDSISINRETLPPGQAVELTDGARFETRGALGRATFVAHLDDAGAIGLQLRTPISQELRPGMSRLVLGPHHDPTPSRIDEIFFRTPPLHESISQSYFVSVKGGELLVEREQDLAYMDATVQDSRTTPDTSASNSTNNGSSVQPTPTPIYIKPGEVHTLGTVGLTFRNYAAPFWPLSWFGRAQIYGLRLFLAMLLIGFMFSRYPQVGWPYGYTIFGCAMLFASIGFVLSARDHFFFPYHPRFREYLWFSFYSMIVLYALRVSLKDDSNASPGQRLRSLGIAFLCIFGVYLLINETFDGNSLSVWGLTKGLLFTASLFVASLVLSLAIQSFGTQKLAGLVSGWNLQRFRLWSIIPFLILMLFILLVRSEALMVGFRIHLPTLLLPVIIIWTAILIWAAEAGGERRQVWSLLAIAFPLVVIAAYGLFSRDSGGSAVLALGMIGVLWLGSKKKSVPLFATLLIILAGLAYASQNQPARFELAWGQNEARLFFEEAKNLRLARDMSRASSLFGHFLELKVPAEVRSNIHSDLVAAYVIGFFGWMIFALLLFTYCLFYDLLFKGLYQTLLAPKEPAKDDDGAAQNAHSQERRLLLIMVGALILTFAGQAMWVASATLQSIIPLTGLDLQPISTSSISVLSFFLVLLGSVALAHSFDQSMRT